MEIKVIKTQKALSPTQIQLADYVINPYRGCEFGCLYCYSQENKNIKGADFFNSLCVKANIGEVLRKQLQYTHPRRVLLGSTTECFQYQETKYGLSREVLSILNEEKIPCTILTKSHLIKNYINLIRRNPANKIYFTLNFSSDHEVQIFEKSSSPLNARLAAIADILHNNIALRVHIGPFIPYVCQLAKIAELIPPAAGEIDVELYHNKMGSFEKIGLVIEKEFGKDIKEKFFSVYKNEENYRDFAKTLKQQIVTFQNEKPGKFFYIVPDFNKFYSASINYHENPLF